MKQCSSQLIVEIALKASQEVMKFYKKTGLKKTRKPDNSFITEADYALNELITNNLYKLYPKIPIVSEEGDKKKNTDIIRNQNLYWLIDPIDGTWSFENQNGDFVINIALIEKGIPIFGLIAAPLNKTIYYNEHDKVYKLYNNKLDEISPNKDYSEGLDFLVSDINMNQRIQDFLSDHKIRTVTPISSAYKFALMCEGKGDIYPRFKTTYIWDTAAGHSMLRSINGDILRLNFQPLKYNQDLKNPDFIATVDTELLFKRRNI